MNGQTQETPSVFPLTLVLLRACLGVHAKEQWVGYGWITQLAGVAPIIALTEQ